MKIGKKTGRIMGRIAVLIFTLLVAFIVMYSGFINKKAGMIELKSRYTFTVDIDYMGNVLNEGDDAENQTIKNLSVSKIGDIWIKEFTEQFSQKYLPRSKTLKKVKIDETTTLDDNEKIVLISFSAKVADSSSEYFYPWGGVLDDGRLKCEWVVKFSIDDHYDGTATIHVGDMFTPEGYGIARYNESLKENVTDSVNGKTNDDTALARYEIINSILSVTYDGGETYITVPVDIHNLLMQEDSSTILKSDSYKVSTTMTAFMYGGKISNGKEMPVTIIYSNDMGKNWFTCEIAEIYTADYYYVEFFDEKSGVVVAGYDRFDSQQTSKIYVTSDGGETWSDAGTGPTNNIIKGVKYIDEDNGFFCYDYVEGMDSNLYMTKDGGKTFSKILLEEQELDSTAANGTESDGQTGTEKLTWSDVYKEALVPFYEDNGKLIVYLTQGSDGTYNSGKTAAKYESDDKGVTWKYVGQYELNL